MNSQSYFIPIKTISEMNVQEHWTKSKKRHDNQKIRIALFFITEKPVIQLPCTINVTRCAPRTLDIDNLGPALKWIIDAIADRLVPGLKPGRADGDRRLTFTFDQKKCKKSEEGIIVSFTNV